MTTTGQLPDWQRVLKRRIAHYFRWIHVYLSMASFAIVFFFAVTGLTLNHTEWFAGQQKTTRYAGSVNLLWLKTDAASEDPKLEIVEFLRRTHGIDGALSDFRVDETQYDVSFKGPGYAADAFIDRATGQYELTESHMGLAAVINDLHKARDTGGVWKTAIDVSAVVLTFVSLTGLVLVFFIHRHRLSGLIVLAAGIVLGCVVYAVWVQ